ncbi:trypsin-like serine protease [Streptomyces panacea]|uniref:trypsin-like serine protease n=1 Tax=Streptomyces panacea TaxID=3035064 RepID=UPI00339BD78B
MWWVSPLANSLSPEGGWTWRPGRRLCPCCGTSRSPSWPGPPAGAGAAEDGKDVCQGDKGGPLLHSDTLVGIVSWGDGRGARRASRQTRTPASAATLYQGRTRQRGTWTGLRSNFLVGRLHQSLMELNDKLIACF